MKKRITKKAWFGKNILRWGYRPVSLEGWIVTVVFLIAILADLDYYHKTTIRYTILAIISIIFFIIAWLTGDEPGSVILDKFRKKTTDEK
jgi:hypothetical protein